MLFPTIDFAVFFLVVFTGSWVLRPRKTAWMLFVLAASFVFYGWWRWEYCLLLVGSIAGNWFLGERVFAALGEGRARTTTSRWLVRGGVTANLAVLGYFKYTGFLADVGASFARLVGLDMESPAVEIVLPIAISFFTFQAISYLIDIGRGELSPTSLLRFAVYLSFFAHLVAGPIVRASEFLPQIDQRPDPRFVPSAESFQLIVRGLFKKVVVSTFLADQIVDPVVGSPSTHTPLEVLFAMYGFAVQIYADFSGYTDIAIGVALLLGIRFPQNFDAPYVATSLQDFWRRWHMTLSRWLRDYLYIPLGGNRRSVRRTYVNLALTMVLGGLWHGASWAFVIWGAIHGGGLAVERYVKQWWAQREPIGVPLPIVRTLQWLVTFHVVCVAWVFFLVGLKGLPVARAFELLGRLVAGGAVPAGAPGLVTTLVLVTVALAVLSQFVPEASVTRVVTAASKAPPILQMLGIAVALVVIDALGPEGIAPFIYFQF